MGQKLKDRRSSCSLGDSESGYQAPPCYNKLSKLLQLLLLQPPKLQQNNNNCRDGRVQDQAELPRGLRGLDQQADQHGILCLVRLSFHEFLLQPGRPLWNGEPHLKPWKPLLSWKRRSTRAFSTCTRWPETRATDTSATSSSPSTWASRWRASRPSGT